MNATYSPHSLLHRVVAFFSIIVSLHLATIAPARAAEKFTLTGSFQNPRYHHAATLLANGKVLVSGGRNTSSSDLAVRTKADLYDPATGKWIATGAMLTGRSQHTATLLPNGKVLAVGGSNPNGLEPKTPELYDPSTGVWSATGAVPSATSGTNYRTALLPDGKLLAIWVVSAAPRTKAALYDPATNAWTTTGTMIATVFSPTLTLLPSGKVLAAGGAAAGNTGSPNAELYDPSTGTWTSTGSLNNARFYHASALLPGGKVIAVGGSSTTSSFLSSSEIYAPATGTWSPAASLKGGLTFASAVTLTNGKLLLSCLYDEPYKPILYNPATDVFTYTATDTVVSRHLHTITLLPGGKVLFAGGSMETLELTGTPLASSELYESPASPATLQVWVGSADYKPVPNGRRITIDTDASHNPLLVGSTVVRQITIDNTGTADLTFGPIRLDGPDADEFTVGVPPVNILSPGGRTTFDVSFLATSAHYPYANTGLIHIDSSDSDQSPFDLAFDAWVRRREPEIIVFGPTGYGLQDNGSAISFGKVKLNQSASKTFTIGNTGGIALEKLVIRKDGKNSKEFTVTVLKKTALAPDARTSFRMTFKPAGKGTRSAAIHIKSNDADENPFDIKLTGAGTAP